MADLGPGTGQTHNEPRAPGSARKWESTENTTDEKHPTHRGGSGNGGQSVQGLGGNRKISQQQKLEKFEQQNWQSSVSL